MNYYTMDNYIMKCYKNIDEKYGVDEEYGYFCDIEGDKIYYMNDNNIQYYPIPQKNNYKIIVQSLPTIKENDEKDLELCDTLTEQKYYDNSNIYINDNKTMVIVRLLFYVVCCIILLS
jgi:hypothetical protein